VERAFGHLMGDHTISALPAAPRAARSIWIDDILSTRTARSNTIKAIGFNYLFIFKKAT